MLHDNQQAWCRLVEQESEGVPEEKVLERVMVEKMAC